MKSFAKIALLVALISIIVLSIVVASVAWFTSNPQVDANDVTLSAARTLNVAFDTAERSNFRYNGQIGNKAPGDDDAPFVYQADASLAAPVTSQVMRCFAPSPSLAMAMARGMARAFRASTKAA